MKHCVSDSIGFFSNFDLQQDTDCYILTAPFQGNKLTAEELSLIKEASQNRFSFIFDNTRLYVQVFALRGNSKNTTTQVFFWEFSMYRLKKAITLV